jgi:hypothetical protein
MARPPSVPYHYNGSMLFVGDANQVQVSLVDIPQDTINAMALKYLAQKLTKIVARGGYPEAQRLATSICTNGRVTRKYVERLPEETILKACLVNYAREKQGVGPLDLNEAASEFDAKIGSLERVSQKSEAYVSARKRTDEILFSYRR